jgi:L-ectoine synthase
VLVRHINDIIGTDRDVDWGNGLSRRMLIAEDNRGYTITDTYVRPGSSSVLKYDNHLESCYCVEGSGYVDATDGTHRIEVGTIYAPDKGEAHVLRSDEGMRLICVFHPALRGQERHDLSAGTPSSY